MHKLFYIIMLLVWVLGCSRVKPPPATHNLLPENEGPPKITGLQDLGSTAIPLGIELPLHNSDKRFSPAEYVILHGTNLGVTQVTIDGKVVPVTLYFGRSPIFRIPTGLTPLKEHILTLETSFGKTKTQFKTQHFISVVDTDGKTTYLIRTDKDEKGGITEPWIELKSKDTVPLYALISKDSQYLFEISIKDSVKVDEDKNFVMQITIYDLGAPEQPRLLKQAEFLLTSSPIDATLNDKNELLLLGKNSFTLVDVKSPENISLIGSKELEKNSDSKTTYVDAIFLDHDKKIALLETYSNKVVLLENNPENNFKALSNVDLLPNKALAFSVDLEPIPNKPNEFWVLEGFNYRVIGSKLAQIYQEYLNKEEKREAEKMVPQLQAVRVAEDNTMTLASTIPLPQKYASFFTVTGQDGRLYISCTKLDFLNVQSESNNKTNFAKKVGAFLWDSIAVGRIIAVDPNSNRDRALDVDYDTVASGVGIYYHLVDIPDIGPAFSLMKLGPSLSFPFMRPVWGVGIKTTGTYRKRKMDKYTVFPPYSLGHVSYQY